MQLKVENITLAYEGKNVLTDLSFSLEKGDYLCVIGENGSGKSTLIKALLGLKKPASGNIILDKDTKKNSRIGYLPQQTETQKDFPASVLEVVLTGCLNHAGLFPFYTKHHKTHALSALESLGIANLYKESYRNLSGGQQQRVLLARALCAAKDMLLLDEPVTGLDPLASEDMYRLISEINQKGTTVIMVSHDIRHAIERASCVLHLAEQGVFFGKTEEYLQSSAFQSLKGGDRV